VLPTAEPSGNTDDRLVVLDAPQASNSDRRTIESFFDAVVNGDLQELTNLFEAEAQFRANRGGGAISALELWKHRLQRLDYESLQGRLLYRSYGMEVFRAQDMVELAGARSLPVDLDEREIAVRIQMSPLVSKGRRLFGDEMVFLLAPFGAGYRISEIVEDFQIP
jgi:hypothetical protein